MPGQSFLHFVIYSKWSQKSVGGADVLALARVWLVCSGTEDSFMDAKATTEANMICDYLVSEFHCHVSALLGDAVRFRIEADPGHWIYIPQEFFCGYGGGHNYRDD